MRRTTLVLGLCLLVGSIGLFAQRGQNPPPAPDKGKAAGEAGQSPEVQEARAALQHDIAEGKRLQEQLKTDKAAKDREAVKRDSELLKQNRDQVKQDQERIKSLMNGRGRGEGGRRGGGRGGDGRGGDGRGGRGRG